MYLSDTHTCYRAANADEAVSMLDANSVDLVLTDITMPGTSGIELCQYINKMYPRTTVVMASGMSDIQYAIEAMRHGAFDYVTKRYDLN